MKKVILSAFVLLVGFAACKKTTHTTTSGVSGLYIENSPVPVRSQLNFISSSVVVKTETGSAFQDTFNYTLGINTISLTPAWTTAYSASTFDFFILDANTIKVENLYPQIPEAPKSYMIYKK